LKDKNNKYNAEIEEDPKKPLSPQSKIFS